MKKICFCFAAGLFAFLVFQTPVHAEEKNADGLTVYDASDYDIGVIAVPIRVKALTPQAVIDAVENDPENRAHPQAVVSFLIKRTFRGHFGTIKLQGPSKYEQMKEAAKGRKMLKLLTLDFEEPEQEEEKQWLKIAVRNPIETFGIKSWDSPGKDKMKLFLKKIPDQPDSYILVKVEHA